MAIPVRPLLPEDREWADRVLLDSWGGRAVALRGRLHDAGRLPTLVAGDRLGMATYAVEGDAADLITINAETPGQGAGSALVAALVDELGRQGVRVLRVVTTNDNLDALRFYQRRGFRLTAVWPGAVDAARRLKPSIPAVGAYGIPIRDEIELERPIDD